MQYSEYDHICILPTFTVLFVPAGSPEGRS